MYESPARSWPKLDLSLIPSLLLPCSLEPGEVASHSTSKQLHLFFIFILFFLHHDLHRGFLDRCGPHTHMLPLAHLHRVREMSLEEACFQNTDQLPSALLTATLTLSLFC